jgi:ABC-2 type transport system ATP-binding protein
VTDRAGGFSLGMGQRLGIAAALLGDPGVLVLDEPVNGLDPEGVAWIRELLKSLAAEGRTVLVSSHLMSEMQNTADRLIIIGHGRLIAQAAIGELLAAASGSYVRVRSPYASELAAGLEARGARSPATATAHSPSPAPPPTPSGKSPGRAGSPWPSWPRTRRCWRNATWT